MNLQMYQIGSIKPVDQIASHHKLAELYGLQ